MLWLDKEVEQIRKFAAEGKTAREIASYFDGRTRNAIIGLCMRKGIKLLASKSTISKREAIRHSGLPRRVIRKKLQTHTPVRRPPTFFPDRPPVKGSTHKTMLELGYFDCRAIIGEVDGINTKYCGCMVTAGKSYCDEHRKIYFVPPQERKKLIKTTEKYVDRFVRPRMG